MNDLKLWWQELREGNDKSRMNLGCTFEWYKVWVLDNGIGKDMVKECVEFEWPGAEITFDSSTKSLMVEKGKYKMLFVERNGICKRYLV